MPQSEAVPPFTGSPFLSPLPDPPIQHAQATFLSIDGTDSSAVLPKEEEVNGDPVQPVKEHPLPRTINNVDDVVPACF